MPSFRKGPHQKDPEDQMSNTMPNPPVEPDQNEFYNNNNEKNAEQQVPECDHMSDEFSNLCRCVAELVGTAMFVFVGTATSGDNLSQSITHGFTIFVVASSLGHISGGHYNPAVTLAVLLCRKIRPLLALIYVLCQLVGGFIGALMTRGCMTTAKYLEIHGGAPHLITPFEWWNGLAAEAIGAFFLIFSVLSCGIDARKCELAPFAIGMTLTVDVLAIGHITGGAVNPARALGPAVMESLFNMGKTPEGLWEYHFIYWIGPIIGAVVSTVLYRLFFAQEERLIR